MVRVFLYGILTGVLLSSKGRKKLAAKGIRIGNKVSRYVREGGARLKEDWKDAVAEAEAEIVEAEQKDEPRDEPKAEPGPGSKAGKPSQGS